MSYHKVCGRNLEKRGQKVTIIKRKLRELENKFLFSKDSLLSVFTSFVRRYDRKKVFLGSCACGRESSGRAIIPDRWRREGCNEFLPAGFYPSYQNSINNDTAVLVDDYFISQLVCEDCIAEAINKKSRSYN